MARGPSGRSLPTMSSDAITTALIAGGGPAAIEAALTLRDTAPEIRVALLTPQADYVHRAMSVFDPFAEPGVRRYPYADLAERGVPHDVKVYPDAGHSFMTRTPGVTGAIAQRLPIRASYHEPSATDATERVLRFLGEHL